MKPMASETKPDISTEFVQTTFKPNRTEEIKEKRNRLKIIAISVVVLVAVVIITAMYVVGKHADDTIKIAWLPYKDETGKSSTQKVTVTSREEKFEIAVFDFDKSLLVYKPDKMSNPVCFLTAVNTSTLLSPEKMQGFLEDKTICDCELPSNSSNHAEYMSSDFGVPNQDFLSTL